MAPQRSRHHEQRNLPLPRLQRALPEELLAPQHPKAVDVSFKATHNCSENAYPFAGSAYSIEYLARPAASIAYRAVTSPADWKALLRPFGVDLEALLVVDKHREAITWKAGAGLEIPVSAPFQLRILPSLFDTKSLLGPNAGALVVSAVSPIRMDPAAIAASGREAQVIATTSEHVRVLDLPEGEFDDADLEAARPAPKQPWMASPRSRTRSSR